MPLFRPGMDNIKVPESLIFRIVGISTQQVSLWAYCFLRDMDKPCGHQLLHNHCIRK